MRTFWLALFCAAAVLPVSSAAALDGGIDLTAATPSIASVRVHRGDGGAQWRGDRPDGNREQWRGGRGGEWGGEWADGRGDRRDGRRGRDIYVQDYYGGAWAYYNNRGWEADSYNDWWHDRPHRALPRWLQRNNNCQRQYWSGDGWTC